MFSLTWDGLSIGKPNSVGNYLYYDAEGKMKIRTNSIEILSGMADGKNLLKRTKPADKNSFLEKWRIEPNPAVVTISEGTI
jgi:hypothetical protein